MSPSDIIDHLVSARALLIDRAIREAAGLTELPSGEAARSFAREWRLIEEQGFGGTAWVCRRDDRGGFTPISGVRQCTSAGPGFEKVWPTEDDRERVRALSLEPA